MPERAFLNKLNGEWKTSGVHIRGAHFDTGVTGQLEFGEVGVLFIHNKPNGKTKRLLEYEKSTSSTKAIKHCWSADIR